MQLVPKLMLRQLYTNGSLKNTNKGVRFSVKNRLKDAILTGFKDVKIANQTIDISKITIDFGKGNVLPAADITRDNPINFPLKAELDVYLDMSPIELGHYTLNLLFYAKPFGKMEFDVDDSLKKEDKNKVMIPRSKDDDYSDEIIKKRQDFIEEYTKTKFSHIKQYTFDAGITQGNCENFIGIAQVPMGVAGPIKINGEHAKGEFLVPMATAEGTLVASYNRGISVVNECGGVKCTIIGDAMQRAPVFVFEDAVGAREFVKWVNANIPAIREQAEASSSVAKLKYIDTYLASKFAYLRFNFSTGDAAGQNMVGRATFVACSWILQQYKEHTIKHFYLESNLATDKKASQINVMRTRGKRVVAELTIKKEVLERRMRVTPKMLAYHGLVANIGSIMSGANNNGLHSANGITAIFIATGQDVANVAESSAGILYTELTDDGDLYISITIPSLIIATYGGGVGLATQEEALNIMGCVGKGKVQKLAEIIAGVVLAGEISLAAAISSSDWVSSHEAYGRNR